MNRNRLLIGVFIALVLAFLTSTFVYKKFQQASFIKPTPVTQTIVVAAEPMPLGTQAGCVEVAADSVARWRAGAGNVHKNG